MRFEMTKDLRVASGAIADCGCRRRRRRRALAFIRETYSALYDDAATARAELLEAPIVLLIVVEVVLALFI